MGAGGGEADENGKGLRELPRIMGEAADEGRGRTARQYCTSRLDWSP